MRLLQFPRPPLLLHNVHGRNTNQRFNHLANEAHPIVDDSSATILAGVLPLEHVVDRVQLLPQAVPQFSQAQKAADPDIVRRRSSRVRLRRYAPRNRLVHLESAAIEQRDVILPPLRCEHLGFTVEMENVAAGEKVLAGESVDGQLSDSTFVPAGSFVLAVTG